MTYEVGALFFLYYFAKTMQDLRRDTGTENNVYRAFQKIDSRFGTKLADWYLVGNEKYNPATPWTADFWHFFDQVRTACFDYAIARLGVIAFDLSYLWTFAFLLRFYILGGTFIFELLYGYVLPLGEFRKGNALQFLKWIWFYPWRWRGQRGKDA